MAPSTQSRFIPLLRGVVLLSILAACGPAPPTAPTASQLSTAAPTDPPRPSSTPTITQIPTETPTVTPTPSPSPTQGPDFDEAAVYSMAHLSGGRLLITIQVPGGIEGIYDVYIGDQLYPCEILDNHPDRLYCVGPEPYVNYSPEGVRLQVHPLYPGEGATPVFEATFSVPSRPTPTRTPTPPPFLTPPILPPP